MDETPAGGVRAGPSRRACCSAYDDIFEVNNQVLEISKTEVGVGSEYLRNLCLS